MGLRALEKVPAADPVLALLHAPRSAHFPGGHFADDAHALRRLAHLDGGTVPRGQGLIGKPRQPLATQALLRKENAFAPLHPAQEKNLDLAGRPGTVFVVTGQQPGLLGGPALWYYKALTALALADGQTRRLGLPVVPVFWVAGDDSDLAECNHLELLEEPGTISHRALLFPDSEKAIPVGNRPVDPASVDTLLAGLSTLWKPSTLELLRALRPGEGNLADTFLRIAHRFLGPKGMLFLNGNSQALRQAARPVLLDAAHDWKTLQAGLEKGSAALQAAGIDPPVALREGVVHAFALQAGERRRLFAEGDLIYTVDRPDTDLTPGLSGLDLTHDVFTRLLVVDSLLPVLGHVLGPTEIRYFAQMAPVFLAKTGDMPLVHPRMAAAILPEGAVQAFAAEGLSPSQAAALKPSDLRGLLQDKAWKAHPAAIDLPADPPGEVLTGLRRSHIRHFKDIGPLERLEKSLQNSWRRYLRTLARMAYSDADSASGADSAPLFRHLRWLAQGAGQDRHLNLFSLINLIGEAGLDSLASQASAADPGLQLFAWSDPSGSERKIP